MVLWAISFLMTVQPCPLVSSWARQSLFLSVPATSLLILDSVGPVTGTRVLTRQTRHMLYTRSTSLYPCSSSSSSSFSRPSWSCASSASANPCVSALIDHVNCASANLHHQYILSRLPCCLPLRKFSNTSSASISATAPTARSTEDYLKRFSRFWPLLWSGCFGQALLRTTGQCPRWPEHILRRI